MQFIGFIFGIALLDITLSGDNALVIGASAAELPPRKRVIAIICGGTGAILLRIFFTLFASTLLQLPWLSALGGVALLIIAMRLLAGRANSNDDHKQKSSSRFFSAIWMIMSADIMMSLDNVLAVGALARGNMLALVLGLLISIGVLLAGSTLVAELTKRLTWLLDIAALVLAWTGASMVLAGLHISETAWTIWIYAFSLTLALAADIWLRIREARISRLK